MLIVAVPVDAPRARVVAPPPMLSVVALELKRLAVPALVVMEPPLRVRLPLEVISPLRSEVP